MGFLDKAKQAAEQAKQAAEQVADRANDKVSDVQTGRELQKAFGDLGEKAFGLADSGAISHPELEGDVARIRELKAKLAEDDAAGADAGANGEASNSRDKEAPPASPQADPTEAVEQPLSGAEAPTN